MSDTLHTDKKQLNLSVFLDLKEAFDTIDQKIMVTKLIANVVRGTAADWFPSYLNTWRWYCSLGNQKSNESLVTYGIPQVSCLDPLLFTTYINDFESCLRQAKAGMYADDTCVIFTSDNMEELIEMNTGGNDEYFGMDEN